MNATTQLAMIAAALKRGESLTPQDALSRFGCFRLAARIYDLRTEGMTIHTEMVDVGDSQVARYTLVAS